MAAEFPCSFGPYVLMRLLGAGSGGAAYLARPALRAPGWPPHVVVKVLRDEVAQHADDIARFEHEARVAVCVEHENVVRVLDAGRVENNLGDQLYLAMDYVDGTMLSDVRKTLADADVYLPLPVSIAILEQALRGVGALHDARGPDGAPLEFVHRDLSPRNVMVDSRGHVRLIDLGLAKSRLQEWMTTPGTTLGSAGYMPPEQAAGDPVDQGADLYAIGAVAYELFSGQRMIAPANAQKMLHDTLTYRHRPIPPGRPEVPAALDAFVERATAHGKNERFRSAEQMRQALLACGIAPAKKSTVAEFLRGRVGPVAPVPIGEEGMDTALTEAHAEHTHIIARRPELMVPDDAPADIMFAPTRAEVSPFSDPAVASSSPVSFVQPPPRKPWGFIVAGVIAVAMVAIYVLVPPPVTEAPTVTNTTNAPPDAPAATVVARPVPTVAKRSVPEPELVAPRRTPKRKRTNAAPPPPPPPPPPRAARPPPPKPARASVQTLVKKTAARADRLRSRLDQDDPDQVQRYRAVNEILMDLTRIEALGEADDALAREQLAAATKRLKSLE
ncbi:MAG: serine/threonine-protein kinase [Deltaproteobacteria bacterium]